MGVDTREKRKALQRAYKETTEVGSVSIYQNKQNGKYLILVEPNEKGAESRFQFSVKTGSCIHPALIKDWEAFGPEAFSRTVLETLKKKPEQTSHEFQEDLETLAEMHRSQWNKEMSY